MLPAALLLAVWIVALLHSWGVAVLLFPVLAPHIVFHLFTHREKDNW